MLNRFKRLQEAIKAETDRYNTKVLSLEDEDHIKMTKNMSVVGISLDENKVQIQVNDECTSWLGLSWLSDLAITKIVDVMAKYVS